MVFTPRGHKIEEELMKPTHDQIVMLRNIVAEGKKYGAYYFSDSPLNRFIAWLEAELLKAENAYDKCS